MHTKVLVIESDDRHAKTLMLSLKAAEYGATHVAEPHVATSVLRAEAIGLILSKECNEPADNHISRPYEAAELRVQMPTTLQRSRRRERSIYEILVKTGSVSLDLGQLPFRSARGRATVVSPAETQMHNDALHTATPIASREKLTAGVREYEAVNSSGQIEMYIHRKRQMITAYPRNRNRNRFTYRCSHGVGRVVSLACRGGEQSP